MSNFFIGEMLGTAILIIIGNGVVMNVSFKKTLGSGGGLIVALFGWGLAVFAGILVANIWNTGGHINPAITLANMVGGRMGAATGFTYIAGQLVGALIGQVIVNIFYWQHIKNESIVTVLSAHATMTSHPEKPFNALFAEYFATAVLALCVLFAIPATGPIVGPLVCGLVVIMIGASLGGVTTWAINPARDVMPRLLHFVMYKVLISRGAIEAPVKGTSISNWKYSWVPIAGPLAAGATMGAFLYC